jgi:hypothetical protein
MTNGVTRLIDPDASLRHVEKLLDQVLVDLMGDKSAVPCSRAAVLLAEAAVELRAFVTMSADRLADPDYLALRPRVQALVPRLRTAERLLAAAAEFYRGWCAVGAASSDTVRGYQTEISFPGPALLAFEG